MRKVAHVFFAVTAFIVSVGSIQSCKYDVDPEPFDDGCYPPEVAEILVKKCATSGCHNTISKDAASGLDLSSWEAMFQGNRNGAVCVPYRSDQSTLFFYINTDTQLPTPNSIIFVKYQDGCSQLVLLLAGISYFFLNMPQYLC